MNDIEFAYDEAAKRATLTFPGGHKLRLSGVTEPKAREFLTKHAEEFRRRDCILHTGGTVQTRGAR
jgi:hypothetical protein